MYAQHARRTKSVQFNDILHFAVIFVYDSNPLVVHRWHNNILGCDPFLNYILYFSFRARVMTFLLVFLNRLFIARINKQYRQIIIQDARKRETRRLMADFAVI